jgi:hypothetical protein
MKTKPDLERKFITLGLFSYRQNSALGKHKLFGQNLTSELVTSVTIEVKLAQTLE